MEIVKKLIKRNFTPATNRKIEFIVIHDTGNPSAGANAEMHYKYFDSADRNASAHYFVDDKQIIQIIEDEDIAWHIGDAKNPPTIDGVRPRNSNAIGIEICINEDGDYFKAVQNALWLTKELMKKYNLPPSRVIRHHDVSGKICPQSMSGFNGTSYTWVVWKWFKKQLTK